MAVPILDPRVAFYMRHPDGQNMVNVTSWEVLTDTTGPNVTKDQQAEAIFQKLAADLAPEISTAVNLMGCYVNKTQVPLAIAGKSFGAPIPGTDVGEPLPSQVAALVSLTPESPLIKRKGRSYIGGLIEGANTAGGVPNPLNLANLVTIYSTWITTVTFTIGLSNFTMRLKLWSPTTAILSTVVGVRANTQWCTQRRRSGANKGDLNF